MGFACLADDTLVIKILLHGVTSVSEILLPEQSSTKGNNIESKMHTHMIRLSHDVYGTGLWKISFNFSVLQKNCKFKLRISIQIMPYTHFLLFTHFKMVKHENKVHIHNPCIFMIIFHILFI